MILNDIQCKCRYGVFVWMTLTCKEVNVDPNR